MFNSIISLAKEALVSARSNPVATVVICLIFSIAGLAMMGVYNSSVNWAKIDRLADPTPQEEARMLDTSFDADALINTELTDLLEGTGSARALVRQFTNGEHNIAGFPFASVKTTQVQIRDDVTPPSFDKFPKRSSQSRETS